LAAKVGSLFSAASQQFLKGGLMSMEKRLDDAIWEGDAGAIDAMTGVYEVVGDYMDEEGT